MELPQEPLFCDICKKKSIFFSRKTPNDDTEIVGYFKLIGNQGDDTAAYIPFTGICPDCGQIKFFMNTSTKITLDV